MTNWYRILAWSSAIIVGLMLAGLGVLYVITGLDTADKLSSVVGGFAAVIGLLLSGYGLALARKSPGEQAKPGPQQVDQVKAGGQIDVIDTVGGSVRLGTPTSPPPSTPVPAEAAEAPALPVMGEQSVRNVDAKGAVRVIRGVGGDVDIAR